MRIRINGEWSEHPDDASISAVLERMGLEPRRVAVERNRELVPRRRHAETALAEGDEVEIVTLVGGG